MEKTKKEIKKKAKKKTINKLRLISFLLIVFAVIAILCILIFGRDKEEEFSLEENENRGATTELGFADGTASIILQSNIEDMNKDNAVDLVLEYYGLELNVPETWTVKEASGKMIGEQDSKASITFENLTDEEVDTYMEEFYEAHHLGDKKLNKFKTDNGYSWEVQIKGVSIKNTYTFEKREGELTLTLELCF